MRLSVRPRVVAGWVNGIAEDAEPGTLLPGTLADGQDLVPTPAGRLRTRGGSRIVATLQDDQGTPADVDHVCALSPFTSVGALAIGWSDTQNKHYAWRLTSDMDFSTGTESTSRHDLTASPSTTWDNGSAPARPVMAEVFEKMFLADATTDETSRNEMLAIDSSGTVTRRTFVFGSGSAAAPNPYCIEEYNGVLFMAGYGSEDAGDDDRPELLRHSYLGRSPDAANGFDADAWAIIGAKGQRITALRKGAPYLLCAKADELYRISGYGRAYPGWQYQITKVTNTRGLGVTNPNALTFAEGFWWGLSAQGPFRTDGFNVESLVGPRKRSWMGIDDTEYAWVTYHPERRLVLFGLHPTEASAGLSDTYPWQVWAWDTVRNVWQPNWNVGASLFFATPITTTTAQGPTAAPSGGSTSSETTSGFTASWTNGDATAQTEYWEKGGSGGTWTLVSIIAAGTATLARTGRTNHTTYYWRVRHKKNGVTTAWNSESGITAQTLISAPGLSGMNDGGQSKLTVTQNSDGTDVEIERSVSGMGSWSTVITLSSEPLGTSVEYDSPGIGSWDYRAKSTDGSWPTTDSAYSSTVSITITGTEV